MYAYQPGFDHHFGEVRISAAVITVVNTDRCEAADLSDLNGFLRCVMAADIAHVVAAINQCRDWRLLNHGNWSAGLFGFRVTGNGQNSGQTGKTIAAQCVVNQLIHNDFCVLIRITNPAQGGHAQLLALLGGHSNRIRSIGINQAGPVGGLRCAHHQPFASVRRN